MKAKPTNVSGATVGATVLLSASIAALLLATLDDDVRAPPPRPVTAPPPPLPPPSLPPADVAAEPSEGYESRWLSRRARAIRRCKLDERVLTWPQAVTCVLSYVYPESSWDNLAEAQPWQLDASELVTSDLSSAVAEMYGVQIPTAWMALLWLRGPRERQRCAASTIDITSTAVCIAEALFPGDVWPPPAGAQPWMMDFWLAVRRIAAGTGKASRV